MANKKDWKTQLIHSDARVPEGFRSLVTPVYRGSTTLFSEAASANDHWNQYEIGYTYGLYGTPTTLELAARVCELEGGFRTIITPGGQSAISLIHLALLKHGDHVLMPESIYGPNRMFSNSVLRRFGVEISYYAPSIGAALLRRCDLILGWSGVRVPGPSPWRCRMSRPLRRQPTSMGQPTRMGRWW